MITVAYQRGYAAGLKGKDRDACPYEGHNLGSLALKQQWLAGRRDAIAGVPLPVREHLTRRKSVRTRWPKSPYVRRLLEELFHISLGGFSS